MWVGIQTSYGQQNSFPWMTGFYLPSNINQYFFTPDGNSLTLNEGDELITDEDRASVVSISNIQGGLRLTLNAMQYRYGKFKLFSDIESMKSSNDKYRFFIIQNKLSQPISSNGSNNGDNTNGHIAEVWISNAVNNLGTITIDVDNQNVGLANYFELANPSIARVQIVRIPIYYSVFLRGGIVRCNPYDGYTGGVLALRTGILNLKSGYFDAAAKGYRPENVTWATGGNGSLGDNVLNNTTITNKYKIVRPICPNSNGLTIVNGAYGTGGDPKTTNFSVGSNTSGTIRIKYGITHTNPYIRPIMGEAGYYKTGQKSGFGAEGGGHGGSGGLSYSGNLGTNGAVGGSGGKGGNVGKGAAGGGIILIRASQVIFELGHIYSDVKKLFYINGGNGENGKNGSKGGNGGNGGIGGNGTALGSTIYLNGGNGAPGEAGNGAQGGYGSNGGNPGSLSLYLKSGFNFINSSGTFSGLAALNMVTQKKPGKAGYGGQSGFKGKSEGENNENNNIQLPLPYSWCSTSGGIQPQITNICNCDSVFLALSSAPNANNISQVGLNTSHYDFLKYDVYVEETTDEFRLSSLFKGGKIRSLCYLYNTNQCKPMFEKMKGSAQSPSGLKPTNLKFKAGTIVTVNPLKIEFKQYLPPFSTTLRWTSNNDEGVLYDVLDPGDIACYRGSCDANNPNNRVRDLPDGELNDDGQEGQFDESYDEKNISLYENALDRVIQNKNEETDGIFEDINIIKQANSLSISILETNQKVVSYSIINTLGQIVFNKKSLDNNQLIISLSDFSSGVYVLILETNTSKKSIKFIHEQ